LALYRRRIRRKPLPLRYILLLSFVFFVLSSAVGLWIVNDRMKAPVMKYAESQSVNLATNLINKAIEDQIGEGLRLDDMMEIVPLDQSGSVMTYRFNTQKAVEYSTKITNSILNSINAMEGGAAELPLEGDIKDVHPAKDGIIFYIPMGRVFDNIIIGSLGPDIPVKLQAIADVKNDIETVREEHQINNIWVEIRLHVKIGIRIIVPFETEITTIEKRIPLAMGYIKGDVPQFYNNRGDTPPSIQIPDGKE